MRTPAASHFRFEIKGVGGPGRCHPDGELPWLLRHEAWSSIRTLVLEQVIWLYSLFVCVLLELVLYGSDPRQPLLPFENAPRRVSPTQCLAQANAKSCGFSLTDHLASFLLSSLKQGWMEGKQ